MTAKKSNSDEISLADAPQSPTGDAGRSDAPAVPVARHPGLRATEAVLRDLTKALKETGPERGRRTSRDAKSTVEPTALTAEHVGLRVLEAVLRAATRKLKQADPKAGRSLSDVATAAIAWPDSDALRGLVAREALRNAHVTRYGTPEKKRAVWAGHQAKVDQLHRDHPRWSYEQIVNALAKSEKCSTKTLKRYTKNPRNKS
jgi:hypothetical protein